MITLATLILLLSSCDRNNEPTGNNQQQPEFSENIQAETAEPEPTEPEPAEPEPPQPLSILAPEGYRHIINTTAARNQIPIELTTYPPARRDEAQERLRVMLMAGDAYDMFVLDNHPLFDLSRMGFLADFNVLIDEDPYVSRDDFFTEALRAWEIDGRLYAFPMNFGFNYVFVNTGLPESIIGRFTQHNSITITELMEIYSSLMVDYPLEFDHLSFSSGSGLPGVSPRWILHSQLGNFIDFDNMIANFTDGRFIELMESYVPIFGGNDAWDVAPYNTLALANRVRRLANDHVF